MTKSLLAPLEILLLIVREKIFLTGFTFKRNCAIILLIVGSFFSGTVCLSQDLESDKRFVYEDKGLRDPFYPVVSPDGYFLINLEPATKVTDIHLEGIIYDPQGVSFAIINGTVMREYDKIGGFKLKKIEEDQVFLEKGDELYKVRLKQEE